MTTENSQLDINLEVDEQVPLVDQARDGAQGEERGVDPIVGRGEIERGEEEEEEEESLEDYAEMVITILQPVAITMLLVVWVVRLMNASHIVIVSRYPFILLITYFNFILIYIFLFIFILSN